MAGVNAYKIYEIIYDEEVAKKTPNLPPKWTHARFLEELVYDLVFPGRTAGTKSSADTASTGSSVRLFSVSYRDGDGEEVYDLRSSGGRKDYCENIKPKRITKKALEGGKFSQRLDGMRHNSIQARQYDYCQYCYYQYMNEVPESNREAYQELRQNRQGVRRCLECNVNLCLQCDNLFHGADLSAYSSI